MAAHNEVGKWGEQVAARYLESQGYTIQDRDWKIGKRDLDIVAINDIGDLLVVAEVKTRTEGSSVDPIQAVNEAKMRNLAIATNAYVKQKGIDAEIRFDIIAVVGLDEDQCKVEHIVDAFNPLLLNR